MSRAPTPNRRPGAAPAPPPNRRPGASAPAPRARIGSPSFFQTAPGVSNSPGRARSAEKSRIGYSATVLKRCGATRAAKTPPSAPPSDIKR